MSSENASALRKALIEAEMLKVGGKKGTKRKRKSEEEHKSKKKKKSMERQMDEPSVKAEENEQPEVNVSKYLKFDWRTAMLDILSKKGGRTKVRKLRKKVISNYRKMMGSDGKTDSELEAKFDKKLRKCKKLRVEEEYVLQVGEGTDCSVADFTAIFVKEEPRDVCSTKAVKTEPAPAPPSPIPGPSTRESPPMSPTPESPPMSPVHRRSYSIVSRPSPSPSPPPRPNSADTVVPPSPCSTSLRRSTRSTRSQSSYRYSGSEDDLKREAFSSGEDDQDQEFVPDHEDDEDDSDQVIDDDGYLRPIPSDLRVKEEAVEVEVGNDLRVAECAEDAQMEELPSDHMASEDAPLPSDIEEEESMDGKRRFVDQWIHDRGESGFKESIVEPQTDGSKASSVKT